MSAKATRIPDPDQGLTQCLLALAESFGDEWVFRLVRGIRDERGPAQAGAVQVTLAQRMIAPLMSGGASEVEAIREIGTGLGYHTHRYERTAGGHKTRIEGTLQNFAKLARGTTRTGRPIVPAEDLPAQRRGGLIPDPDTDLVQCLFALAESFGDEWAFRLVRGIRDHRGPGEAGAVQVTLAQRMIAPLMSDGMSEAEAIRQVGASLGYRSDQRQEGRQTGGTQSNFAKVVRGTTRTGREIQPAVPQ